MVDEAVGTFGEDAAAFGAPERWIPPQPDEPDFEFEMLAYRERTNHLAVSLGLPPAGSPMTNAHGLTWRVDGHTFACSLYAPDGLHSPFDPRNLFPAIVPGELSPRLMRMLNQLNLCTPKVFVPLDTMPGVRQGLSLPHVHATDSISDPGRILLFLDAANVSETILAHELGHVWIEIVEGIEDYRVYKNRSELLLYRKVQELQSLVLDFEVNRVLRAKGFDLSSIERDQAVGLANFASALSRGYKPDGPWEEIMIAGLGAELLANPASSGALTRCAEEFSIIRNHLPTTWDLANRLASIIESKWPSTPEAARNCIDQVLLSCFAHAGVHINLHEDLEPRPREESWIDRWPQWMVGLAPQLKCEIGKAMARADVGPGALTRFTPAEGGSELSFSEDGAAWSEPVLLPITHAIGHSHLSDLKHIEQLNGARRRYDMLHEGANPHGMPGTRNYSSGLARFVSVVRLQEQLGGEHPYSYGLHNPIRYTDPSGNKASDCCYCVTGLAINASNPQTSPTLASVGVRVTGTLHCHPWWTSCGGVPQFPYIGAGGLVWEEKSNLDTNLGNKLMPGGVWYAVDASLIGGAMKSPQDFFEEGFCKCDSGTSQFTIPDLPHVYWGSGAWYPLDRIQCIRVTALNSCDNGRSVALLALEFVQILPTLDIQIISDSVKAWTYCSS